MQYNKNVYSSIIYKTYVKINEDLTLIGICSSALGELCETGFCKKKKKWVMHELLFALNNIMCLNHMLSLAIWKLGQ